MLAENQQAIAYSKRPEVYLKGMGEKPVKNAFCPYYRECLDRAIEEDWPQFTCANCVYQDLHVNPTPDSQEILNYYRLLERIFKLKNRKVKH